jgi:hypothetical protein
MGKFNLLKSLAIPLPFLIFSLSQCKYIEEGNEIKEFYIAPNFKDYKIETIALLPMANDDTTNLGTFYSTNYFYNNLAELNSYNLVDIDKITSSDSSTISDQLISIRESFRIDLDSFYVTPLGQFLKSQNCDAIIIGNVFDYSNYYYADTKLGMFSTFVITTAANFNYFMVSLLDGSVLWGANIDCKASYKVRYSSYLAVLGYPPLDLSISNGIDRLLDKLKKEFILTKK